MGGGRGILSAHWAGGVGPIESAMMRVIRSCCLGAVAGAVFSGSSAVAQTGESALTLRAGRPWSVQVEPMLWGTSPSGKLRLPGGSGGEGDEVEIAELNLDTPRASPLGKVSFKADEWLVSFSGAAFSLSREETPADTAFRLGDVEVGVGDALDVDFDYATAEVSIGRRVYWRDFNGFSLDPASGTPVRLSVYALGGLRLYDLDAAVRNVTDGGFASSQQVFIEPMIGGRAIADLAEDFAIDLQVSGGYYADSDRSVSSLDISLGFVWRPHDNVGVQLGWRQLLSWMEDGDDASLFSYNGGLAGLYTGVVITF
jgi:hypothetical protein